MTIGKRIKDMRQNRGISREEFHRRSGVPSRTLLDIELDRANPQINTLIKVADSFGVSLSHMFKGVDKSK